MWRVKTAIFFIAIFHPGKTGWFFKKNKMKLKYKIALTVIALIFYGFLYFINPNQWVCCVVGFTIYLTILLKKEKSVVGPTD